MKGPVNIDHRRAHMRFEIVGKMPGAVVSTQTLQVVNLGVSGALVEAACALPEYAEYRVQLVLERHVSEATVKVRRVVEAAVGAGGTVAISDRPGVPVDFP